MIPLWQLQKAFQQNMEVEPLDHKWKGYRHSRNSIGKKVVGKVEKGEWRVEWSRVVAMWVRMPKPSPGLILQPGTMQICASEDLCSFSKKRPSELKGEVCAIFVHFNWSGIV